MSDLSSSAAAAVGTAIGVGSGVPYQIGDGTELRKATCRVDAIQARALDVGELLFATRKAVERNRQIVSRTYLHAGMINSHDAVSTCR